MLKTTRNVKVFVLILLTSALLIFAISPTISNVKAATQDSVYVYTSCGGTISAGGTNLTGGTTYNYTDGSSISFTAMPIAGCKFLYWEYAAGSGANTSTTNPFIYKISSAECAIQAMFIPDTNASSISNSVQTGTTPFQVLISIGGTTVPGPAIYTNYTIGTVVNFVANPGNGFKFLYWIIPSASGGDAVSTYNPLEYNVTANACAVQAFFVPTSSNISLPTIATVDEFSSAMTIITTIALVIAAFGTYAYTRRAKK